MTTSEKRTVPKTTEKPVYMYPNNGLKEPVRSFKDTFSAVIVVKEMFFNAKGQA